MNQGGAIDRSYASGLVTGDTSVGGLVGQNTSNGKATNSYRLADTASGSNSTNGDARTSTQMMTASTYQGWDMQTAGGNGSTWRLYEGQALPLLQAFLTTVDLGTTTLTYNGSTQTATLPVGLNVNLVLGSQASGRNAGTYSGSLYSSEGGYDFVGGSLVINRKALTVAAVAADRVYDGTRNATVSLSSSDVVGGDQLTYGSGSALFDDKNVGVRTASVTGITIGGSAASNYTLQNTTASDQASITAREVTVTGVTAQSRQYDGTRDATLTSVGTLTNVVQGENLNLSAAGATFADKNVVGTQTVTATGYTLGDGTGTGAGLASNYVLKSDQATTTASITPATLTYTATAQTATVGDPLTLSGAISGFVAGETVANATTGTLTWATPGDTTQAGVYAINGGGLTAGNYVFAQADANAVALTLNPAPQPATTPLDTSLEVAGLLRGGSAGGAGAAAGNDFVLPTDPTAAGPGEGGEEEQEVAEKENVGEGSLTVINQGVKVPKGLMF